MTVGVPLDNSEVTGSEVYREIAFTDSRGCAWTVVEFRIVNGERKRVPFKSLPMGDARAEGRAFIPNGWVGDVLLYRFGTFAHRGISQKTLQSQLDDAHRVGATPAERMQRRPDTDGLRGEQ